MSFILEALRKSEHERQKQTGPIVANQYAPPRRPQLPLPLGWMIGIAALLVINIVVVVALVLRDNPSDQTANAPTLQETRMPPPPVTPPAELPPAPVTNNAAALPPPAIDAPATPEQISVDPPVLTAESGHTAVEAPPAPTRGSVPTINELNLLGADALPPLHLDIHVYATKPAERFVFLNSRKYREGAQTNEGLTVEAITSGGVILNRNGLRFLLPRP